NYKKGHVRFQGLDITIENRQGSVRSGTAPDGTKWENEMAHHYGYIKRTEGADGDHVDVFVGPDVNSDRVFVIDQIDENGNFDEHKVMLGFPNQKAARDGYRANYDKGWKVGPTTAMAMDEFKAWLADGDTTKPIRVDGKAAPSDTPAASPKQEGELIERFGVPAGTEFQPGPARFNRGKFRAVSGNDASGYRDTKEAAAKELAGKIATREANERRGEADDRARTRIAEKIKAGEKPSNADWETMFPPRHVERGYVRQADIGWFLVDYLGVPRNRIKASIGKAAGKVKTDMGAEYPIVYLGRLHDAFSDPKTAKSDTPDETASEAGLNQEDNADLFSMAPGKPPRTPWQPNFPKAVISLGSKDFQKHPDYRAAKEGDIAAAVRLAKDSLKQGGMV
ncbi:MAG: hypothetical protein ACPH5V_10730, partial [Alcanivorax sp.]